MPKYKIGVFGSAGGEEEIKLATSKAQEIGVELAKNGAIIITGGCTGLPYIAALAAHQQGSEVWGFSPVLDMEGQNKYAPDDDNLMYKQLVFVDKSFQFFENILISKKYRNVLSTATCDAGIIIAGRWGTLNEFTNLYDFGKVIGVLTGSGGIADELPQLSRKISKIESKGKVIFSSSPEELVQKVISELEKNEPSS